MLVEMVFISKKSLETKLSDISNIPFTSYGKSRVSGSVKTSYIMHCRSKCMPGQENLFVVNSHSKLKDTLQKDMLQLRMIYKRNNYKDSKQTVGNKYTYNCLDLFTYRSFHPYSDESLQKAIIAAYKQIYGNLLPMESEYPRDIERRLRNGDIPIRDFIRELAKSNFYRKNYFEIVNQKKCIELNFMHILGRPLIDQIELQKNIEIITREGFEGHVDYLIDSLEYEEFFGEDIVPFQRYWNSPCGGTTSSFINTASFRKGFASSDNVNL